MTEARYGYPLSAYAEALEKADLLVSWKGADPVIRHLSFDTRELVPDTLFFCKGVHFKPAYLAEASRKGAVAYVSEVPYGDVELPCLLVTDVRRAMSLLALFHFGHPAERLATVGLTGTKGKSTTAFFIKSILDHASDRETAILSSIETFDGVVRKPSELSTPEAIPLQRHLANAADSGLSHLVMEVSSQALKYGRVEGVTFDVACFLNLGADHISPIEHPDLEDYYRSKRRILDACRVACIGLDADRADETLAYAKAAGARTVTFGTREDADFRVTQIRKVGDGLAFTVLTNGGAEDYAIAMGGHFNVENALAAVAVCSVLGVTPDVIRRGLLATRVPGRMEIYRSQDGRITAVVDYAHNRLSFEKLYETVEKEYPGREAVTVFGCPGGKALTRRRDMGELAGRHSAFVYITEDDPGEESPEVIAAEIADYVVAEGCPYRIVLDRQEAIRMALEEHGTDRVVLVVGKGNETRQKRGTGSVPMPADGEYVKRIIAAYDRMGVLR